MHSEADNQGKMADEFIEIEYSVTLQSGELKRHVVRLDSATGALQTAVKKSLPAWTELGFHQCPNCPLNQSTHKHCPVAVGLVDVVESFKNCASYEVVDVTVRTANRTYQKRTSLQEVVGSLMGLHMASGGCPLLDKLRPLVVTHLPFASVEETLYRTVSMYLLAQYFRWKRGLVPDWEMQGLVANCESLASINVAFGKRILSINTCDANLNALVGLDCFSGMTGMSISQGFVDESLEALFEAHLKPGPVSKS
jgi:hypothetical protein